MKNLLKMFFAVFIFSMLLYSVKTVEASSEVNTANPEITQRVDSPVILASLDFDQVDDLEFKNQNEVVLDFTYESIDYEVSYEQYDNPNSKFRTPENYSTFDDIPIKNAISYQDTYKQNITQDNTFRNQFRDMHRMKMKK